MGMTSEMKQEFTLRISRANSTDMVVILYDIALFYLKSAKTEIENHDDEKQICQNISMCRNTIIELMNSLNLQYEPAPAMRQLYIYSIRQLTLAELRHSVELLEIVEKILSSLRDAYEKIAPTNKGGVVMGNSQEVFAGLTYGKGSLTENIQDQGSNRGFLV